MNPQRYVCVYFDDEKFHLKILREKLGNEIDFIRYFNGIDETIEFIFNLNNTQIFLITRNEFAKQLLPIVHSSSKLHSIYLFDFREQRKLIKEFDKIKLTSDDFNEICSEVKRILSIEKCRTSGISFVSSDDFDSTDKNRQDPTFMYFQLIKEILLHQNSEETEEQRRTEFIKYCQQICADDEESLQIIRDFEVNYLNDLAIYWYTRECFIYRILNRSLRQNEISVLYRFRYFLCHLHQQIVSQSEIQTYKYSSIIVYRGQNISQEHFHQLESNRNGYLSFNSFLSTSFNRNIAKRFTFGTQIGVLFEIYVDTTMQTFPFAPIEHISYQQGVLNEKEVLFSIGTVFRIVGIEKEKDFHRIQLMLTNEIDQQLNQYTQRLKNEVLSPHSFLSLIKLFYELKQYEYFEEFIRILQDDFFLNNQFELIGRIENLFGLIYHDQGHFNKALKYLEKSRENLLIFFDETHPRLASTYNNLGIVYSSQSNYNKALQFYQLALDCQNNSPTPNINSIITYISNMAHIYNYQRNYQQCLQCHQQVLELKKENLGDNDPSLATTYTAISSIYYKINNYQLTAEYQEKAMSLQVMSDEYDPESASNCLLSTGRLSYSQGEYKQALDYFQQALQIQKQYFLSNHPSFSITFDLIGKTYYELKSFQLALEFHLKCLSIEEKSLAQDHPSIGLSYFHISRDYLALQQYKNALNYAFKAIQQTSQFDFTNLYTFHRFIAEIYFEQEQFQQALEYFEKSLEFVDDQDKSSMTVVYYRIGSIHQQLSNYSQALIFFKKTLDLELETLDHDAQTIATTYSRLATVYFHLNQLTDALEMGEKALNQLLKTLSFHDPEVNDARQVLDQLKILQLLRE